MKRALLVLSLIIASIMVAAQPAAAAELAVNGGFETGSLSPWTCTGGLGSVVSSPVHSGTKALQAAASASDNAQCTQTISVVSGTSYTLSGWFRGNYTYLGVTGGASTWTPGGASYTQLTLTFTAAGSSVQIYTHGWYGQGTYYADDISLQGAGGGSGTVPGAPSGLTSTGTTAGSISLSWGAASGTVTGYRVYEGSTQRAQVTGTTATISGLGACTSHTYTVKAYNANGESAASGSASGSTTGCTGGGNKLLGYFVEWGVYARNYHVKNIHTSGSASKLTHINYAFGNVTGGGCQIGDAYADYDKFYDAASSVNGVADTWDAGALRGNFGQLRRLKQMYPGIKILWSFGGWTWSGGFGQAAANPTAFANSCYNLVEDPRWADVFDGIDIDWEYPNACGLSCDTSGFAAFKNVMSALRTRFGSGNLVTAAITADGSTGGKIDAADYGGAAQYLDWYNVMTYDYFGAWAATGPTAPHSPLNCYSGIPTAGFCSEAAIAKLKSKGVPSSKLLLGIGFYGRGWTGVTQATPGGTATGPAPGTYEQGIEDYKVLKASCPSTGTIAGTAYAKCGANWWSYDTPSTIGGKMSWAKNQGLGGAFFWELTGDTTSGELITSMKNGLG